MSQRGKFAQYGGQFVPETLMNPLKEVEEAFNEAMQDEQFVAEFRRYLAEYNGRPTPLTYAERLTAAAGGARIYLKREDLNHTGAHKINNALGQALLAKRLGKEHIIAETGAGQHGVAAATVCAHFGMKCTVFMGAEDIERQSLNVFRMKLLGAEVVAVHDGSKTLKDATSAAIRHWVAHCEDHFYMIGSAIGPHPYPTMVRQFQQVIGEETRAQIATYIGRLPEKVIACVGGGSNAIGMFHPFLHDDVALVGVEAAGKGIDTPHHAATLSRGRDGVIHGTMTKLIQDEHGQIIEPYSISAGLDYPGIGPEHAFLHESGRVRYEAITDAEAMSALQQLTQLEGILPAIESAHAVAQALKEAPRHTSDEAIVVCLSGRGDKDIQTIMKYEGGELR